jgi:hypothetical protein
MLPDLGKVIAADQKAQATVAQARTGEIAAATARQVQELTGKGRARQAGGVAPLVSRC